MDVIRIFIEIGEYTIYVSIGDTRIAIGSPEESETAFGFNPGDLVLRASVIDFELAGIHLSEVGTEVVVEVGFILGPFVGSALGKAGAARA